MKKRYIFIAIIGIICISFVSLILYFNIPRIKYTLNEDKDGYIVEKAYGNPSSYFIKATYNDLPVYKIADNCFNGKTNVKNYYFEEGSNISIIGRKAFANNEHLENIILPRSVLNIKQNAFYNCYRLKTVSFEEGSQLKYLGGSSFFNCYLLEEIDFPSTLKSVGTFCFFNNKKLKKVNFPQGVQYIYTEVFYNNDALQEISLFRSTKVSEGWLGNLDLTKVRIIYME